MNTHLAVIGAGPGGYVAAFHAADLGMPVTLIDADPKPLEMRVTCAFCSPRSWTLRTDERHTLDGRANASLRRRLDDGDARGDRTVSRERHDRSEGISRQRNTRL
jgi:NADPH-dependent 2,4-dienoyl-CoA reductase/sulfur reductase-like enzyme